MDKTGLVVTKVSKKGLGYFNLICVCVCHKYVKALEKNTLSLLTMDIGMKLKGCNITALFCQEQVEE